MIEGEKDKYGVARPDLESIAEKLATMRDDHHIDQIMPRALHAFFDKVRTVDENGVPHYKNKDFSEKEAEEISDAVFDEFLMHSLQKQYGIVNKEQLDSLKAMKDKHGKSLVEAVTFDHYQLRRHQLRKAFVANRDNLSEQTVMQILERPLKYHNQYHLQEITKDLDNRHVPHLKDFVQHYVKDKGIDNKVYENIKEATTLDEVLETYINLANTYFKKPPKKDGGSR